MPSRSSLVFRSANTTTFNPFQPSFSPRPASPRYSTSLLRTPIRKTVSSSNSRRISPIANTPLSSTARDRCAFPSPLTKKVKRLLRYDICRATLSHHLHSGRSARAGYLLLRRQRALLHSSILRHVDFHRVVPDSVCHVERVRKTLPMKSASFRRLEEREPKCISYPSAVTVILAVRYRVTLHSLRVVGLWNCSGSSRCLPCLRSDESVVPPHAFQHRLTEVPISMYIPSYLLLGIFLFSSILCILASLMSVHFIVKQPIAFTAKGGRHSFVCFQRSWILLISPTISLPSTCVLYFVYRNTECNRIPHIRVQTKGRGFWRAF